VPKIVCLPPKIQQQLTGDTLKEKLTKIRQKSGFPGIFRIGRCFLPLRNIFQKKHDVGQGLESCLHFIPASRFVANERGVADFAGNV